MMQKLLLFSLLCLSVSLAQDSLSDVEELLLFEDPAITSTLTDDSIAEGLLKSTLSDSAVLVANLLNSVDTTSDLNGSTGFQFDAQSSFYRNTGESRGAALFSREDSQASFEQNVSYETFTDHDAKIGRYHLLLDGEKLYNLPNNFALGIEWIPSFYHSKFDYELDSLNTADSGYGVVSLSLGPAFRAQLGNLPIRLSGGAAIDVWNDQLRYKLSDSHAAGTEVDFGGYFSLQAGAMDKPLFEKISLYGQGSIFGRYMNSDENSNFTRGDVQTAYLADSVLWAESLVVVIGDTLLHGRLGGVYTYSGGGREENQPSRVNNSFAATVDWIDGGYGKWFLTPSVFFSLYDSRYRYLQPDNHIGLYSSRNRFRVATTFDLKKNFGDGYLIRGGITFGGGSDEYFYENSFIGYTSGQLLTDGQVDSATIKLNDAEILAPKAYASFGMPFSKKWVAKYLFEISREQKLHPFYYVQLADTVQLTDDIDNARQLHRLSVDFTPQSWYSLGLSGEFSKYQINFLHPQKSAGSRIDKKIKFDIANTFQRDSTFHAQVVAGSVVTPQSYLFDGATSSRPSHARRFYILSKGELNFGKGWGALARVDYYYRDLGFLSGEYYGISEKNYEFTGVVGGSYSWKKFGVLSFGSDYKRQRIARWSDIEQDWIDWVDDTITTPDTVFLERRKIIVYQFAPYMMLKMRLPKGFFLRGKVKHYIDIVGDEPRNYWDLALTLSVEK